MIYAVNDRPVREHRKHPEYLRHLVQERIPDRSNLSERTDYQKNNSLGSFEKSYLTGYIQRFGPRPGIADHHPFDNSHSSVRSVMNSSELEYLESPLSGGCTDFNLVAFALAHQSSANRRRRRYLVLSDVGILGHHERIG